jgi:hypothetical protein
MAAIEITFSPERTVESLLYIATHLANPSVHEALKISYFADKLHLSRYGWLASGDDYVAMKFGPVGSGTYNLLKAARGDQSGWIHPRFVEFVRDAFQVADDRRSILPLREPDLNQLSRSEVTALAEALQRYADMPFAERTELSHDAAWSAAWNIAADDEVGQSPMPLESIAATLPNSEELIAHLRS